MADTAIFDVDGALVDTNYQHAVAQFGPFRRYGITGPRWRIHRGIGIGKWMARLCSDGMLVGRGGLSHFDLEGEPTLELGWTLRDAARGHGYAIEIGRAALDVAFDDLRAERVVAFTEVHNHASQAVMQRLGMRPRGLIHRPGLVEGAAGVHENAPFALYDYGSAR